MTDATEPGSTEALHMVLYTDGGCKPSRGIGGWGVHGYVYTNTKPKQGSGCKTHTLTPKGYVPKAGADLEEEEAGPSKAVGVELAGTAVVEKKGHGELTILKYIDGWGSLIPESTNNEAELTALHRALTVALELGVTTLYLRPDSNYVIEGYSDWLNGWARNGWLTRSLTPVANQELWKEILVLKQQLEARDVKVTFEWVQGHSGDLGNDTVDQYASQGIVVGRKGVKIDDLQVVEAKGYWSPKVEINRMLSQSKWYFNTHMEDGYRTPDGRYVYFLGEHGTEDDFIGKRVSDSMFSIVYLKDSDPVMEGIRRYVDSIDDRTSHNVMIGRLDNLFRVNHYNQVKSSEGLLLQRLTRNMDLFTVNKVQLVKELDPPKLAFVAIDTLTNLNQILEYYIHGAEQNKVSVTDLTDLLYEVTETTKGKSACKLKPTFLSSTREYKVQAEYNTGGSVGSCGLSLTVGLDLPDRNTLSALAVRVPKVSLVTWRESDRAFRYATVVEAGDDIGIWAGIYSNLHILIPQ